MPPSSMQQIVRDRIAVAPDRALSFAAIMELALYDASHGYYGRGPLRIGRSGDFYTAVSVGPLFGRLLAELAGNVWRALGMPEDFTIIEQGAHDGQLMEDVANGLAAVDNRLAERARFLIVERNERYRAAQAARLTPLLRSRVTWVDDLEALLSAPKQAFFMTNELLDAFPVHRVRWTGSAWVERSVARSDDDASFVWKDSPVSDSSVKDEVDRLPRDLPPGYTTEVHPASIGWMRQVCRTGFRGALLIADYGFENHEYYSLERCDGTVRRYHAHQMDGDVLQELGTCDLTAHINFSRLIDEAAGSFETSRCLDQGRFLTRLAAPWLRSIEGTVPSASTTALLRQFHTLTHPGHMGGRFRSCLLARGVSAASVIGPG